MKRLLKWMTIIVLTPLLLIALLILLFYLPPVQDWAVQRAAAYASGQTGYEIRLQRLRITPLLDVSLQGLTVCDAEGDTLVAAKEALVDLDLHQLFNQRIVLEGVALHEAKVNTKEMMASAAVKGELNSLELHDDIDLLQRQVNISKVTAKELDVEVTLRDTTVADTTTSAPLDWTIAIARADIREADVRLTLADSTRFDLDSLNLTADSIHLDLGREHLRVPRVLLATPSSRIDASVAMDFKSLESGAGGTMDIGLRTSFSKSDILSLGEPWLPEGFGDAYPDLPLAVTLALSGNIDSLSLQRIEATLPGSISLDARGDLVALTDSSTRRGTLDFNVLTQDLDWIRPLTGSGLEGILLPKMQLDGTAHANGPVYALKANLREGEGMTTLEGTLDTRGALTYNADISAHRLHIRHFIPSLEVSPLTAKASLSGSGTDFLNHASRLDAHADLQSFSYDKLDLSNTRLTAKIAHGHGNAHVVTDGPLLAMDAEVEAALDRITELAFSADVSRADLHALGIVDHPLRTAMRMHLDGATDLKASHRLEGTVTEIQLMPGDTLFRPEDVTLAALLRPDTTYAHVTSGDLELTLRGHTGYERLLSQFDHFTQELQRQLNLRHIDQQALTRRLPQVDLRIISGQNNPLHDIAASMGYEFENLRIGMRLDPVTGINGGGRILALNTGAILLDTIGMHIYQDSTDVRLDARVHNNRRNPQFSFDARMNAFLNAEGLAGANLIYYDDRGKKGVDLGMRASMTDDGYLVSLDPFDPIIAYRTFHLNKDNFVMLGRDHRVEANVDLLADDGTGLHLYSTPNAEALQDLTVSINQLNLGELTTVIPYIPRLAGYLHGDAHLIQTSEHLSIAADMNVNDLVYEGSRLGQVGLQAVYLPNADGSHFIDGILLHTGMPVATYTGSYTPKGEQGLLDIDATLDRLPFALLNGFIPDGMARLEGVAVGGVHVGGTTAKPDITGEIGTVGLKCISEPYSLNLAFADDTLHIADSNLRFDSFSVYSTGKNPFVLNGQVNFADLSRITLDANMSAKDFELINAKKTAKALAYGKAFVDFNAYLRGTLDHLRMMGRLKVLGNTDLTYVLADSPLTVEDQLDGLVEFVDFTDSTYVATEERAKPQHLDLTMSIEIDDAAMLHCLLSPDASSYVDLEGGGDLMMTYSPEKDLQLNGRYTINSGTIKYTMMVIPLKEFSIKSGSYVEFRGPLMNPTLNLSASERVRTTVTENDHPRSVTFNVGLNITQTLENMGLEFTLEAPEDMAIQNDLSTMSTEQRGRLAVTMLATGMYINDAGAGTSGGFTGQNALNAFLQGQISNITSKALKSVDLSVGMEQGTSASGSTTTDYSFRFAKRFWGNRISIIVGGKVSTGDDAQNTGQSLIDNVSIEYRLDKSATRYVNLFYDKNYESMLDGEVTEMGAGLVLRRKTNKLGELFLFRNKSEE
ncbi:MAG: translocation/assembly module TamB [Bacteroidales bacterium]|nr:translocation/assembly module TamB [Bacteroidales bacterium]